RGRCRDGRGAGRPGALGEVGGVEQPPVAVAAQAHDHATGVDAAVGNGDVADLLVEEDQDHGGVVRDTLDGGADHRAGGGALAAAEQLAQAVGDLPVALGELRGGLGGDGLEIRVDVRVVV